MKHPEALARDHQLAALRMYRITDYRTEQQSDNSVRIDAYHRRKNVTMSEAVRELDDTLFEAGELNCRRAADEERRKPEAILATLSPGRDGTRYRVRIDDDTEREFEVMHEPELTGTAEAIEAILAARIQVFAAEDCDEFGMPDYERGARMIEDELGALLKNAVRIVASAIGKNPTEAIEEWTNEDAGR